MGAINKETNTSGGRWRLSQGMPIPQSPNPGPGLRNTPLTSIPCMHFIFKSWRWIAPVYTAWEQSYGSKLVCYEYELT